MKSPTVFTNKTQLTRSVNGFTLVEILVTMGLVAVALAIGSLVNIRAYTREIRTAENMNLVAVLQKARSRSMNNIDATTHGVHIENGKSNYIIFEGNFYNPNNSSNENVTRNNDIKLESNGEEKFDIIFEQLSGNTKDARTIVLTDTNQNTNEVKVYEKGLIDW